MALDGGKARYPTASTSFTIYANKTVIELLQIAARGLCLNCRCLYWRIMWFFYEDPESTTILRITTDLVASHAATYPQVKFRERHLLLSTELNFPALKQIKADTQRPQYSSFSSESWEAKGPFPAKGRLHRTRSVPHLNFWFLLLEVQNIYYSHLESNPPFSRATSFLPVSTG